MKKLSFGTLIRTTMSELSTIDEVIGVYILAYMGQIVYIGKATDDITARLAGHLTNALNEPFGAWLRIIEPDWANVRLDILTIPDDQDKSWANIAEGRLIRYFHPLFNLQNQ